MKHIYLIVNALKFALLPNLEIIRAMFAVHAIQTVIHVLQVQFAQLVVRDMDG